MGCSPSHAVIINSSPTHETICLQPRIYMVSDSTLCLLRDVGELRVYHVDERDPDPAVEKFQGAQEQLQNPLLFHPQLRRRERIKAEDLQSLPGSSSVGKEIEGEDIKENAGDRIEIAANEGQGDDVDDVSDYSASGKIIEDLTGKRAECCSQSSNAHSVTVEVYSYKINADKSREDGEPAAENVSERECSDASLNDKENDRTDTAVAVVATSEHNQTPDNQTGSALEDSDDVQSDAKFSWTETANQALPAAKQVSEIDSTRVSKAERQKATANEEIMEIVELTGNDH